MRYQNKGNLTLNTNLEWLSLAFEATRFGGGLTARPPRHDPTFDSLVSRLSRYWAPIMKTLGLRVEDFGLFLTTP